LSGSQNIPPALPEVTEYDRRKNQNMRRLLAPERRAVFG
jgi:hypothetical protein